MIVKIVNKIFEGIPIKTMIVLFTIIDGLDSFNWAIVLPIMENAELKFYLESRLDELRAKIYSIQYPGGIPGIQGEETLVEAWQRWEAGGCMNSDETKIQKIDWVNSFEYDIYKENFKAVKSLNVTRLLKNGLVAEAIIESGGL